MSRSTAAAGKRGSVTASTSGWQKPTYPPAHAHHSDDDDEEDDSDDPGSSNSNADHMQDDDDDDDDEQAKDASDSDSDDGSSRHHRAREAAARREREVEEEIARRRRTLQKQKELEDREAAARDAKMKEDAKQVQQQQKIPVSKLNLNAAVAAAAPNNPAPIPPQPHPSGMQCIVVPSTSHTLQVVPLISFAPPAGHHSSSSPVPPIGRAVVKHTQEISFNDMIQISYITFRNFYTQFLTIKQMVVKPVPGDREGRSKQVWTTILHRFPLMANPHSEMDAQKYCLISVEQFNHNKFQPQNLHRFRFDYYQSSPNWKSFSLNEIQFWCVSIPSSINSKDEEEERRSVRRPTSGLNALGRLAAVPQSVLDKLDSPSARKSSSSGGKNDTEIEGSVHSILNMFPSTNKTRISTSSTIRARIEEVLAMMNFDVDA